MNRTGGLSTTASAEPATEGQPFIQERDGAERIDGVGVLRFPEGADANALNISRHITKGGCLVLPNSRDYMGAYEWDFRIEGGDPKQVRVERPGEPLKTLRPLLPTHAYCNGCGCIREARADQLEGLDVTGQYVPTDLVCSWCHLIIATLYRPVPSYDNLPEPQQITKAEYETLLQRLREHSAPF